MSIVNDNGTLTSLLFLYRSSSVRAMAFTFSEYLKYEWVPTLGCTEPAAIAYAAATARMLVDGPVKAVHLRVDPRMFKNCFAVGIPYSDHKTGIRWAAAIGSQLASNEDRLTCFRHITKDILSGAQALVDGGHVHVDVEGGRDLLLIDCRVAAEGGTGRVVIEGDHTNVVLREKDDVALEDVVGQKDHKRGILTQLPFDRMIETSKSLMHRMTKPFREEGAALTPSMMRAMVAHLSFDELMAIAAKITNEDRAHLRGGVLVNRRIAEHGLTLFPERFVAMTKGENLTRISALVCAGVYARMWGEDLEVISLAGSGNKGLTVSIPLSLWAEESGAPQARADEALALACLVTSATTHHLGSLSAVCGCSNAAGIGLAAGLVYLDGGGAREIGLAVNNMVGNVSGMICDGAKIGCALKTMTAVDAAFRAASLAEANVGIPYSDGIVGHDGNESLRNLGRIAGPGMEAMDREILAIMREKLTMHLKGGQLRKVIGDGDIRRIHGSDEGIAGDGADTDV